MCSSLPVPCPPLSDRIRATSVCGSGSASRAASRTASRKVSQAADALCTPSFSLVSCMTSPMARRQASSVSTAA